MRGITSTVVLAAWTSSVALGCACAGNVPSLDGGPIDAAPLDAAPLDGSLEDAGPDAAGDGGEVPLPPCDTEVASWAALQVEYPGQVRHAVRAREGTRTSLVLVEAGDPVAPLRLREFDEGAPTPRVAADVVLAGTEGMRPLAAARDTLRIATLAVAPGGASHVLVVHDPGGGLLSRAEVALSGASKVSVALRATRVGLVVPTSDVDARVEVRDVAGGEPLVSEVRARTVEASVGLSRGLFAFVAASADDAGPSMLYGLDDLGVIPTLPLGARLQGPAWDGATVAGLVGETVLVRHLGGREEVRAAPDMAAMPVAAISIADGPHGAVIARWSASQVLLSPERDGASVWVPFDVDSAHHGMAETSPGRVGAFVLDGPVESGSTLRWVGLSCALPAP